LLHDWQVSLRWKCLIRGITAAALPIGLVATLLATPQYTATSGIEISSAQKNVTNVESLESAEAGRNLEFYQTQYSLMVRNLINAAFSKYIQYGTKSLK
jgi:uncharacterized protein involved in exopolysaccharide biosynthesis